MLSRHHVVNEVLDQRANLGSDPKPIEDTGKMPIQLCGLDVKCFETSFRSSGKYSGLARIVV